MDYRFARAFLSTAKHESFSRAAEELRIAQSAVSRQIRLLEDTLGEQLFIRSSRRVKLTGRGKALYLRLNDFDQWVSREHSATPLKIKIMALDGVMSSFVIPRLATAKLSGNIDLHLASGGPQQIVTALNDGEADIGFTYDAMAAPGYRTRVAMREEIVLISKRKIDPGKISSACWVHMGNAKYLSNISAKHSGREVIVSSLEHLIRVVAAGIGIGAVPASALSGQSGLHQTPIQGGGRIHMYWRDFAIIPPSFAELLASLSGHSPDN